MTAAVKNLTIEQWASFKKKLTYRDKLKKPIDLTGFAARMQVRDSAGKLLASFSTDTGEISLIHTKGIIQINVAPSVTGAMSFSTGVYDLVLIAPDGSALRLLQGKVTLSPGQTQSVLPVGANQP